MKTKCPECGAEIETPATAAEIGRKGGKTPSEKRSIAAIAREKRKKLARVQAERP